MYVALGIFLPPSGFDASKYWVPCGNVKATQTMLANLGFYAGKIDGDFGTGSQRAASAFADQQGLPKAMSKAYCQALLGAWTAKMAPKIAPVVTEPVKEIVPQVQPKPPVKTVVDLERPPVDQKPGLSTPVKYALIGGGVLAVGGIAYVLLR